MFTGIRVSRSKMQITSFGFAHVTRLKFVCSDKKIKKKTSIAFIVVILSLNFLRSCFRTKLRALDSKLIA